MLLGYQVNKLRVVHKISCLSPPADSPGLLDNDPHTKENMSRYYFRHYLGLTMIDWS